MSAWRSAALALIAYAAAASGALAQDAPAAEDEIVVTGERLREIARAFVADVAAPPGSEDQLARWDRRICPGVIGLRDRAMAQAIIDRVAQRAFQVGLDVADPGCRADVIIFITPDADALAAELREAFKEMLNYYSEATAATQGRDALDDFVETPRAVRWWSVSEMMTREGFMVPSGGTVSVFAPSRLRRTTRQDLSRVIVIVDATRAQGMATDSLADYVAMVSLAQIDMNADASDFSSILNLFSDGPHPAAMTEWDLAYLNGLYGATREARDSNQQADEISRDMAEELAAPEAGQ